MRLLDKEYTEKYAAPPQVLETPWQWWHIQNVSVLPRGWACLRKTWPQWQSQILWKRRETGSTQSVKQPCSHPVLTVSPVSRQTCLLQTFGRWTLLEFGSLCTPRRRSHGSFLLFLDPSRTELSMKRTRVAKMEIHWSQSWVPINWHSDD